MANELVTKAYDIDISKTGARPIVKLSQYDTRTIRVLFTVYDGNVLQVLDGCTARVDGRRSDGTAFTKPCEIEQGSKVGFTIEAEMTNAAGMHDAELVIINSDGNPMGTQNFVFSVEKSPFDRESAATTDDRTLYDQYTTAVDTRVANAVKRSDDALAASKASFNEEVSKASAWRTNFESETKKRLDAMESAKGLMTSNAPLPSGGGAGQVLAKASGDDYDVTWKDEKNGLPSGGLIGQVLAKTSASDYDVSWQYQQTGGLTCENIFTGQYSWTHNHAVDCSKPVTDFDFIDVQFSSESGIKGVTRVYGPTVGTLFETDIACNFASDSGFYMLSKVFKITENSTINTWNYNDSGVYVTGRARLWGGNQSVEIGDFIGITAVWGWKGDQ